MMWPDIAIAAVLMIAVLKGYKRGFIMEISGMVALALSLITPWLYNGAFDDALARAAHLGSGSAHVIAMFAVGAATYLAVLLLARALSSVRHVPVLGVGNALSGAIVGFLKGAVFLWVIIYIALFFPLTRDVRADLHRSRLVSYVTAPNTIVDRKIIASIPWFARPYVQPVFDRHRV
jgi:uncharacterized membrane protein required for colicin V production